MRLAKELTELYSFVDLVQRPYVLRHLRTIRVKNDLIYFYHDRFLAVNARVFNINNNK